MVVRGFRVECGPGLCVALQAMLHGSVAWSCVDRGFCVEFDSITPPAEVRPRVADLKAVPGE